MKKQLLGIAASAALFTNAMNAEITLSDDLSTYGYIDVAYADNDMPGGGEATDTVAEFEIGFEFNQATTPYSANVELSFNDSASDEVDFEEANITYQHSDELSFTVGNILSYIGFESFDATGLYQYSNAYRGQSRGFTNTDLATAATATGLYTAAYAVGVGADYVTDQYALGLWIGDSDNGDISVEFLASYTGVEGLTVTGVVAEDENYSTINLWASYEYEAWTFAAEMTFNDFDKVGAGQVEDNSGYLLLANYDFGNGFGLTGRYSAQEDDLRGGGKLADFTQWTIAPSYTFSDNLSGLFELSLIDEGTDYNAFAFELIYTF